MKKRMLFISRHKPTEGQEILATLFNYELIHVGDVDAFNPEAVLALIRANDPEGSAAICCVHPAVAITAIRAQRTFGFFENGQRAEEGKPTQFFAKMLHVYSVDGVGAESGGYAPCYGTKLAPPRWVVWDNGSGYNEVSDLVDSGGWKLPLRFVGQPDPIAYHTREEALDAASVLNITP